MAGTMSPSSLCLGARPEALQLVVKIQVLPALCELMVSNSSLYYSSSSWGSTKKEQPPPNPDETKGERLDYLKAEQVKESRRADLTPVF